MLPKFMRPFYLCCLMAFLAPTQAQTIQTTTIPIGSNVFTWVLASETADFHYLSMYATKFSGTLHITESFAGAPNTSREVEVFHEGPIKNRVVYDLGALAGQLKAVTFHFSKPTETIFFLRSYTVANQNGGGTALPATQPETQCACAQPAYCSRACWCPAGNCDPVAPAVNITPTHLIVHHSAGSNTSNNFAAVVAAIRDFHVNTNGWDDIGYNWLIDPNGVIYEGRGDGKRGAHFSCMNGGTTGICLLGNYQTVVPANAAIDALENLLAWEACSKNVPAGNWGWHAASQQHMPHVAGHRDGNQAPAPASCASGTACPGNTFYPQLQALRMRVAANNCFFGGPAERVVVSAASTLAQSYLAGTNLDFEAQQTYLGTATNPRNAELRVYLSSQQQLTSNAQMLGFYAAALDSSASSVLATAQWPIPAGLAAGTWYLHFLPDGLENFQLHDSASVATVPFEILGTIGTDFNPTLESFSVYPNPAADWLEVAAAVALREVAVYDLQGRRWLAAPVAGTNHRIAISGLPAGTYIVQARPSAGTAIFTAVFLVL